MIVFEKLMIESESFNKKVHSFHERLEIMKPHFILNRKISHWSNSALIVHQWSIHFLSNKLSRQELNTFDDQKVKHNLNDC